MISYYDVNDEHIAAHTHDEDDDVEYSDYDVDISVIGQFWRTATVIGQVSE